MKNDWNDKFDDLKQFIDSRISQSEKRFESHLETRLREEISGLRTEMQDGFASVAEIIEQSNDRRDKEHAVFDNRMTKVEKKIAA